MLPVRAGVIRRRPADGVLPDAWEYRSVLPVRAGVIRVHAEVLRVATGGLRAVLPVRAGVIRCARRAWRRRGSAPRTRGGDPVTADRR